MSQTRDEIERRVLGAVSNLLPDFDAALADSALLDELGLDSMQIMDLAMEIEDQLDIAIPVEVLSRARTLRELISQLADNAVDQ